MRGHKPPSFLSKEYKTMKQTTLSPRLLKIASLVPQDARPVDVGSDHAYLPVHLVKSGRVKEAYATDVNEGPILRARANIEKAGLADKILTRRCDGLDGVEDFAPDTVTIAGMGGELIADIVSKSEYVKKNAPLLILQPMTQAATLRCYLAENGFTVMSEHLLPEVHRIYQIIVCRYTAQPCRRVRPLQALIGEKTANDPHLPLLFEKIKAQYTEIVKGKRSAGQSADEEEQILKDISEYETH